MARTPKTFGTAADEIPPKPTLPKLRRAAADCKACDLWINATQTVFGEGPARARVMFVGEQPGDREDEAGEPFVGPSGRLLDAALEAAELDRREIYVTNVVKHFKWEPRGKRRIHKKPNAAEITACRPWLDAELAIVQPDVVVCLGATAAQSLLGKQFRITRDRGKPVRPDPDGPIYFATVHPSAVLRVPGGEARARAEQEFLADIRAAARLVRRVSEEERPIAKTAMADVAGEQATGPPPGRRAPKARREPPATGR